MTGMDEQVTRHFRSIESLAGEIHGKLQDEVVQLGFDTARVVLKSPAEAVYRLEKDPADGQDSLVGVWLDRHDCKLGNLVFHADGSFFVEQDIVLPHPTHPRWFVEAVNAWGRGGEIKAEARLLPVPE